MLKLLERNIATIERRLVLLAPPQATLPESFTNITVDSTRHAQLLRDMQRMRGRIYMEDGALERHQLSPEGLHQTPEDDKSWHLLMLNNDGEVSACEWYLEHSTNVSLEQLRAWHCPLVKVREWSHTLRLAVESEIQRARRDRLRYAEVGGWAVSKDCRCSSAGLLLALGGYSLARALGGSLMMVTATVRHSSSTILRRLGGSAFEFGGRTVPAYFDPKYNCEMELLRFDSRRPNERYIHLIELLRSRLSNVSVLTSSVGQFGHAAHATAAA